MIDEVASEQPDIAAHAAPDGQVTILFSDIEDSTLMTERLGDERWLAGAARPQRALPPPGPRATAATRSRTRATGSCSSSPTRRGRSSAPRRSSGELAEREPVEGERVRVRMGMHAGRGDPRGGRLLRPQRDPRGADRGPGARRRDPRLRGAQAARRRRRRRRRSGSTTAASSSSRASRAPTSSTAPTGSSRSRPERRAQPASQATGLRTIICLDLLVGHPRLAQVRDHLLVDDPDVPVLRHPGGEHLLDRRLLEPVDRPAGVRGEEDPVGVAALEQRQRRRLAAARYGRYISSP